MSEDHYSLTDALDHEILMQRDAHFGGDFTVMARHYQEERMTHHPEITLERIAYLAALEKAEKEDLAPLLLTGPEAERVARARHAYAQLKALYEAPLLSPLPRLIADLILTEEEMPEPEIAALVAYGKESIPALLQLLGADDSYDTLFPGYGYAPYYALLCLRRLPDPSAIRPLFGLLQRDLPFEDSVVLDALHAIGAPAKAFLLQVLRGKRITNDTLHAAYALAVFSEEEEVAHAAQEKLRDPEVQKMPLLRDYLLNLCVQA